VALGHQPRGIAAGVVIAREAGATVSESGGGHGSGPAATIAGPASLVAQLSALVQAVDPAPPAIEREATVR
jgi:fructose-1,6-bisphosphatase/inositol monophosphatase family enzyme